jgi:hypothetical protein
MRSKILTEKERKTLERFLNENDTTGNFRMLKLRIKRNHKRLNQDFNLIDRSFKKFSEKTHINRENQSQKKEEGKET